MSDKRSAYYPALAYSLLLLLVWLVCFLLPRPQNFALTNPMRKAGELPILIAHGGGNREFPDNTLEAFYNAYSVDPRVMMETDVSITRDGVVILSHDVRLDRKTNVTGEIAEWNYADLIAQKVDFGYTNKTKSQVRVEGSDLVKFPTEDGRNVTPLDVPYPEGVQPRDNEVFLATTLEELITSFPENRINVEIKQSGEKGMECLKEILRLLEKHNAWDRVVLASFHDEIYNEYVRLQKAGEVPETFMCSPGLGNAAMFYVMHLLGLDVFFQDDMCVFQLPIDYSLAGLTFVVTGDLNHFANRKELQALIEKGGGKVTGSVTKKTHFLINNDVHSASSKNKKAAELGIPILSEEDFLKLIE